MIVLDANILVRAVLGRRARQLIDVYAAKGVRFFTPEIAFADAEWYLPDLLERAGKATTELPRTLEYLRQVVESVDRDLYSLFEDEARRRLRGRDDDDWPVLALAPALSCAIWTEHTDFFGTGVAVWTTSRIEIFLDSEISRIASEEK